MPAEVPGLEHQDVLGAARADLDDADLVVLGRRAGSGEALIQVTPRGLAGVPATLTALDAATATDARAIAARRHLGRFIRLMGIPSCAVADMRFGNRVMATRDG